MGFYYLSTPFSISDGILWEGFSLPKISSVGIGLPILVNLQKWSKNAIKVNFGKILNSKKIRIPWWIVQKQVFRSSCFLPPIFALFWALSTWYFAIFYGSGGIGLIKNFFRGRVGLTIFRRKSTKGNPGHMRHPKI